MEKILICKIENTGNGQQFYGQTETGEVFEGAIAYPDTNGDKCLMQVFPASGFGDAGINEVIKRWGFGPEPKDLIEVETWGDNEIEKYFPKATERWFVEIPQTKKTRRKALNVSGLSDSDKSELEKIADEAGYEGNVSAMIRAIAKRELLVGSIAPNFAQRLDDAIARIEALERSNAK